MKKGLLVLLVAMFSGAVFSQGKVVSSTVELPADFRVALPEKTVDMTGLTVFEALQRVYEKGNIPTQEDLTGYHGGLAYSVKDQNDGMNFYLLGQNKIVPPVPPGGPFDNRPEFRAETMFKWFGKASYKKLAKFFVRNQDKTLPVAAESESVFITYTDMPHDRFYVRKFDKYLIVKHVKRNKTADYAYLYYTVEAAAPGGDNDGADDAVSK